MPEMDNFYKDGHLRLFFVLVLSLYEMYKDG